jgi:hypothetical protein
MTTAGDVAAELRKLAEALDKEPEANVVKGSLWFWNGVNKDSFLNLVRLVPRPLKKVYEEGIGASVIATHETDALTIELRIARNSVCQIVEPAKPAVYKCEPLLTDEKEATLAVVQPITATVNQPQSEEWNRPVKSYEDPLDHAHIQE